MELVDLSLAATAIVAGAVVQRVSGVGGGFIMVPLLAMIDVSYVPGPLIFATLVLSGLMAWQEREAIDFANVAVILAAFVPGAIAGAWVLSLAAAEQLGVVFGSTILVAVLITLLGLHPSLNRGSCIAAGLVAGVMGASSGIGAPALAILYHRQSGAMLRATLALLYTCCSLLILIALALFGRFAMQELYIGVLLTPGFVVGYLLGAVVARRVGHLNMRYLVLSVSAAAAAALIVRSLG